MVWQRGFLLSSSSSSSSLKKRQINKPNVPIHSSIDSKSLETIDVINKRTNNDRTSTAVNDDIQYNTSKNVVHNQQGNTTIHQSTVLLDIENNSLSNTTTTLLNSLLPNLTTATTTDKEIQEQNDENTSLPPFLLEIVNKEEYETKTDHRNQERMHHFNNVLIQEVESHTAITNDAKQWDDRMDSKLNHIDETSASVTHVGESESESMVHNSQYDNDMYLHDHLNRLILHLRHTKHRMWQSIVTGNDTSSSSSLSLLPFLKTVQNRHCIWLFLISLILQFDKPTTTTTTTTGSTNVMKSMEMWLCRFLLWNYWNTNHNLDEVILSIIAMESTESFQNKQQQLVIVTVLDVWFDDIERKINKKCSDIDDEILFTSLLGTLVPKLVTRIDSQNEDKTTVLIRRMMYLVYRAFALTSQYVVHSRSNTLSSTTISCPTNATLRMIWKQSNLLARVFQIHNDQVQKDYSKSDSNVSLIKRQKRDCTLVVIQDWMHTYQMYHEQSRNQNLQCTYKWCQRLTSHQSPMHFGSLIQSLFPSSSYLSTAKHFEFSHLFDVVTAVQVEKIEHKIDQYYIVQDIVRGLVAFLGQRISNTYRKCLAHRNDMITILNWLFYNVLTDIRCCSHDEVLVGTTVYDYLKAFAEQILCFI
jgi:hypothetical protein